VCRLVLELFHRGGNDAFGGVYQCRFPTSDNSALQADPSPILCSLCPVRTVMWLSGLFFKLQLPCQVKELRRRALLLFKLLGLPDLCRRAPSEEWWYSEESWVLFLMQAGDFPSLWRKEWMKLERYATVS
jgi:hypothetical protein